MAGICSRHRDHCEPGCAACNTEPGDLFENWDEKLAEAKAAGLVTCSCGFKFYRTADACPLCGTSVPPPIQPEEQTNRPDDPEHE